MYRSVIISESCKPMGPIPSMRAFWIVLILADFNALRSFMHMYKGLANLPPFYIDSALFSHDDLYHLYLHFSIAFFCLFRFCL